MKSRRSVTPQMARRINDRIVLDLLLEHGPLTRTQLRNLTGMSQPSTLELIERLDSDRLLTVVGESGAGRRGPNARLYGIVTDRAHVAVARISRTEVSAAIADVSGAIRAQVYHPVQDPVDPAAELMNALDGAARDAAVQLAAADGVLVGTAGAVDPHTGDVDYVAGLPGWRGNVRDPLEQQLGQPVRLENQMNLVGIAEHQHGAGRGFRSFAVLSIDHSVGVAVILNDRLWRGASGAAGELAYMPAPGAPITAIEHDQNTFTGGYATLISGAALLRLAQDFGVPASSAAAAISTTLTADVAGEAFLGAVAERIAIGAAALSTVVDPGLVVLTGAVGRAGGAPLATMVEQRLHTMSPVATEVRCTRVEGDPVLRGAISAVLNDVRDRLWGPPTPG